MEEGTRDEEARKLKQKKEPMKSETVKALAAVPSPKSVSDLLWGDSWAKWERFEQWLVNSVGITEAFVSSLSSDDDWTMAIKLHALIETGLNHLLITHFNKAKMPQLDEVIPWLENSDFKSGKVGFAVSLGLLPKEFGVFVVQFSQLRNFFVHDAKNFGKKLTEYKAKSPEKWKELLALGLYRLRGVLPQEELDGILKTRPSVALRSMCWAVMHHIFTVTGEYHEVLPTGETPMPS